MRTGVSGLGHKGWLCSVTLSKALKPHIAHLLGEVATAILQACCDEKSVSLKRAWVWKALSAPQLLLPSPVEANNVERSC